MVFKCMVELPATAVLRVDEVNRSQGMQLSWCGGAEHVQ